MTRSADKEFIMPGQAEIDRCNSEYWNELCGTHLAKSLGIEDSSPEALEKFDRWYFDLYPYLLAIVRPERMAGKRVLEIGLGYGTLGQKLAEAGADYCGLDIAAKPVEHMNWRLAQSGLNGQARVGSALDMPFAENSFDYLVSIGCFHHTGNVQRAIDETYRVLKPGGACVLMVYNKYSWRQWQAAPAATFRCWLDELCCANLSRRLATDAERAMYDSNQQGEAAPETTLHSIRELGVRLQHFQGVRFWKQNADPLVVRQKTWFERKQLLNNLGRCLVLDIYLEAKKPAARPSAGAVRERLASLRS
ncbi:MAG: class I SAM-dependent methyltransferase [Gemmataceae bacterium]